MAISSLLAGPLALATWVKFAKTHATNFSPPRFAPLHAGQHMARDESRRTPAVFCSRLHRLIAVAPSPWLWLQAPRGGKMEPGENQAHHAYTKSLKHHQGEMMRCPQGLSSDDRCFKFVCCLLCFQELSSVWNRQHSSSCSCGSTEVGGSRRPGRFLWASK